MWSLVAACELFIAARGIWFPDQGLSPRPLRWEHRQNLNHWTTWEVPRYSSCKWNSMDFARYPTLELEPSKPSLPFWACYIHSMGFKAGFHRPMILPTTHSHKDNMKLMCLCMYVFFWVSLILLKINHKLCVRHWPDMVRQFMVFMKSSVVLAFHQFLDFKEVNKPEHLSTDGYFLPYPHCLSPSFAQARCCTGSSLYTHCPDLLEAPSL